MRNCRPLTPPCVPFGFRVCIKIKKQKVNGKTIIDKNELFRIFYFASKYVIIYFIRENEFKEESWSRFH